MDGIKLWPISTTMSAQHAKLIHGHDLRVACCQVLAAQVHPAFQRFTPGFCLVLIVPFRNHSARARCAGRGHRQTGSAISADGLLDDLVALLGLDDVYILLPLLGSRIECELRVWVQLTIFATLIYHGKTGARVQSPQRLLCTSKDAVGCQHDAVAMFTSHVSHLSCKAYWCSARLSPIHTPCHEECRLVA